MRPGEQPLSGQPTVRWIVPGPIDQLTGGYLYDARIVEGLRARGHAVVVANLRQRRWPLDPGAAIRLARALRAASWDVAVVDELAHPAMALGLPMVRRRIGGRPILALVHHLRCSEPARPVQRRLAAAVERVALASVDRVICTSQTTAATVRRLVRSSVAVDVVPPGRDTHAAGWLLFRPRQRREGQPFRVLMVAHWTPRKGIVEASRALALAPRSVELDLVGDLGRDARYTRRVWQALRRPELAGRVRVHGRVSSERLVELYGQADALLLMSSYEGYGMVLAEALAAGLPVVATRVGAVPEVVCDGREADLIGPGDVDAAARALARLAADPAEWRRRGEWARERAAALPRWSQASEAFARVLVQACRGGAGG